MFGILSFLQGGWPIFEKGGIEKGRGKIYKEEGLYPKEAVPYMTQGSSKACIVCPYVCLLTTFLKISTLDFSKFFCMWQIIFNLQILMPLSFRGRFKFWHKGPKLGFSCFFQKILPSDVLGLILNKSSCNSHCKLCVKKTLFLRYDPKCFDRSHCRIWKNLISVYENP